MPKPLSPDEINKLLQQEAERPARGQSKKLELLENRIINNWFKLNHHLCTKDCEHREQAPQGSEGRACWNPNCKDNVRKPTDRGAQIVVEVKGQWICRYCYLDGYLR